MRKQLLQSSIMQDQFPRNTGSHQSSMVSSETNEGVACNNNGLKIKRVNEQTVNKKAQPKKGKDGSLVPAQPPCSLPSLHRHWE